MLNLKYFAYWAYDGLLLWKKIKAPESSPCIQLNTSLNESEIQ